MASVKRLLEQVLLSKYEKRADHLLPGMNLSSLVRWRESWSMASHCPLCQDPARAWCVGGRGGGRVGGEDRLEWTKRWQM